MSSCVSRDAGRIVAKVHGVGQSIPIRIGCLDAESNRCQRIFCNIRLCGKRGDRRCLVCGRLRSGDAETCTVLL